MMTAARPQRSEDGRGRLAAPLNLIHTTKPSNPIPARVSADSEGFPGPLAGAFRHPCGVWVSVQRMCSGLPWGRTLGAVSRATVFGGAYGPKSR